MSSINTVVNFTLGGTAAEGSDYTAIPHSVTIPAGSTTATITIPVIDDAMVEPTETVTVTLVSPITSGNAGISVNTTAASRNITDNDFTLVTVTTDSSGVTVNEGSLATDSGTYSQPDGHNVAVTASIGTVTKTGTSSGTGAWSFIRHRMVPIGSDDSHDHLYRHGIPAAPR